MRWFVEVSRVGENSSDERYCVEAKQWQAALQEARKLRGDSGPLSKFSIELLDDGYRAVDPKQKLRYVVAKAPQDAELSSQGAETPHRNGQQVASPSAVPPAVSPSAPSAAPIAPSAVPAAVAPSAAPIGIAPPAVAASAMPAAAAPIAPPAVAASAVPAAVAPSAAPIGIAPVTAAPPIAAVAEPGLASVVAPAVAAPALAQEIAPPPPLAAHAEPYAGVPSSALSPNAPPSAVHLSPSVAAAALPATPAAGTASKSPSAFPPRPIGTVRSPSARPPGGITVPADVIPPAPALPQGLGLALPPQTHTQPSAAIDLPPPSSVLRKRQEEPTPESPITYREIAYVVEPGVTRGSVEALLWASFRDISRELADRAGQKFVQLAVFDHKFERRPERPPLGTLAWKDWRGNPALSFPHFDGTPHVRPSGAPPSVMPPSPSIVPVPVVAVTNSAPPVATYSAPSPANVPASAAPAAVPASAAPAAVPASAAPAAMPASAAPSPVVPTSAAPFPAVPASAAPSPAVVALPAPASVAPATSAESPIVIAPPGPNGSSAPPGPAVIAIAASASTPPVDIPAAPAEPAVVTTAEASEQQPIALSREKLPSQSGAREKLASHPGAARGSRPRMAAVQRRAGEDLIGELFETMHDLHFMSGVAEGAEFVLAAVDSVVPCDGMLIHVFDINSRHFVVVRAKGPGTMQVLLHRTPDSDPFFSSVMRRPGSVAVHDVQKDGRVLGPRWAALGVQPTRALCGPVRQGGRYLGLLEVVNPMGDAPFHQNEQNAIDYVCEQFAQFLANRPIVLDADVILRR